MKRDPERASVRRRIFVDRLALGILVAVGLVAVLTGVVAGPAMAVPVAGAGVATLAIGRVGVRQRRRLGFLGRQLAWTAGAAVSVGLLATWALAAMRADESPDLLVVAALLTAVALGVIYGTYVVGNAVTDDLEDVRRGLLAVGDGHRDVRLDDTGADEASRLAAAGNRMIDQLAQREAERDDAQATRESLVRAMVDQLRTREAEYEAAEALRRRLVAAASHDVRSPLTSLTLLAAAVRDELVEQDELAGHAEQMLRQLEVISRLTDQVFELARLEAGDVRWTLTETQVCDIIREAVEHLRPDAAARRIDLEIDVPSGLPRAHIAPDRILRVIVNLVQNALQYTPPGGEVCVRVREQAAFIVIEVTDTGIGISPEDRGRVFEPFFRGGQGPLDEGRSSGLGLAISRAIVAAHGGQIELVDVPIGTCVRFTLPV